MESESLRMFRVAKLCSTPGCKTTWTGTTFIEPKPGDPPVTATCDRCVAKREATVRQAQAGRMSLVLKYPPTAEEDQPYSSRRGRS